MGCCDGMFWKRDENMSYLPPLAIPLACMEAASHAYTLKMRSSHLTLSIRVVAPWSPLTGWMSSGPFSTLLLSMTPRCDVWISFSAHRFLHIVFCTSFLHIVFCTSFSAHRFLHDTMQQKGISARVLCSGQPFVAVNNPFLFAHDCMSSIANAFLAQPPSAVDHHSPITSPRGTLSSTCGLFPRLTWSPRASGASCSPWTHPTRASAFTTAPAAALVGSGWRMSRRQSCWTTTSHSSRSTRRYLATCTCSR